MAIDRSRLTPRDSGPARTLQRPATPAGLSRVVLAGLTGPTAECRARPVPDVAGRSVRDAALALHRRGFRVTLRGLGQVTRTLPAGGESANAERP